MRKVIVFFYHYFYPRETCLVLVVVGLVDPVFNFLVKNKRKKLNTKKFFRAQGLTKFFFHRLFKG